MASVSPEFLTPHTLLPPAGPARTRLQAAAPRGPGTHLTIHCVEATRTVFQKHIYRNYFYLKLNSPFPP